MRNGTNSFAGTPADPTVRYAKLELSGEEYSLVFDFNAIATAEQVAKVNLLESFYFQNMTAAQFRGMFYAALRKAHPEISLQQAGDLITVKTLPVIQEALLKAWQNSITGTDHEDENPPRPLDQAARPDPAAERVV
jgi:hypothetical protein